MSNTSALLLADDANTRSVLHAEYRLHGQLDPLTFRAWDQTSGTAGTKVTTATNGGATAFSSATDTITVTVTAAPPQVDLDGAVTQSAIDTFVGLNYTGASTGAIPWAGNWIEVDPEGAAQSAGAGDVQVVTQAASNRIRLSDDGTNNGGTIANRAAISRALDLSGYTNASLSFDLSTSNNLTTGDTETYVVEVSTDGGSTYTTLQTYTGNVAGTQTLSLAGDESAATVIRFRLTSNFEAGEYVYIDNVTVSGQVATTSVTDDLASGGYAGASGGAIAWAGNWTENDPDGGAQSAGAGDVQINVGRIRLGDDGTSNGGANPASIRRAVDLSGYVNARLSFDLSSSANLDATDTYVVEASSDGGVTFATLLSYADDVTGAQTFNLAGYESANTVIRFRLTADFAAGEYVYIDNVAVRGESTGYTNPTAYTENGASVAFPDAAAATITDDGANLNSLSLAVGNHVAGDRIAIDGSTIVLANGASGTTTGNSIAYTVSVSGSTATLTLTGTKTVGIYQTILRNARFDSISDDPTADGTSLTRRISVIAYDSGSVPSNVAIGTVNLTAATDAPVIGAGGTHAATPRTPPR